MGKKCFAVTGGCGFLGRTLVRALVARGARRVVALDIVVDASLFADLGDTVAVLRCDITNVAELTSAVRGCHCVMHCASYFGAPPFFTRGYGNVGEEEKMRLINVQGTTNCIRACESAGVDALVYTSSVNVAFTGTEHVRGIDETADYPPLDSFVDLYGVRRIIDHHLIARSSFLRASTALCLSLLRLRAFCR